MNDPHVKTLHYRVVPGNNVDYEKAAPITVETDDFSVTMNSKDAIFEMKNHFTTKNDAKKIVDSYLMRWDLLIGLELAPGDLTFIFQHANIIDRAPVSDGGIDLNVHSAVSASVAMDVVLHVSRGTFPTPPLHFALTPDVETMYIRYKACREGRESLLSMAYMCLTVLKTSANGKAAEKYTISETVLKKLGNLCTERGSPAEARKKLRGSDFIPLSAQEKEWVIQVVKAIIRRTGEHAFEPTRTLPQLTMSDFPTI